MCARLQGKSGIIRSFLFLLCSTFLSPVRHRDLIGIAVWESLSLGRHWHMDVPSVHIFIQTHSRTEKGLRAPWWVPSANFLSTNASKEMDVKVQAGILLTKEVLLTIVYIPSPLTNYRQPTRNHKKVFGGIWRSHVWVLSFSIFQRSSFKSFTCTLKIVCGINHLLSQIATRP